MANRGSVESSFDGDLYFYPRNRLLMADRASTSILNEEFHSYSDASHEIVVVISQQQVSRIFYFGLYHWRRERGIVF